MSESRFTNKSVLISGAASGIGRASALRLASEGAFIIATDIDEAGLASLRHELGEACVALKLDVREERDWQGAKAWLDQSKRSLDALINCAGITGFAQGYAQQDAASVGVDALRAIMAVNLEGTIAGCQFAIAAMKSRDPQGAPGMIVNLGSRSGIVGIPMASAYAASKAAVINYSKSIALLCAGKGWPIRCNSLSPAAIDTPMWDPVLGTGEERASTMQAFVTDCPLKRFGSAEEAAAVVAFLASSDASYMTGTDVPLDGGILAGSAAVPE